MNETDLIAQLKNGNNSAFKYMIAQYSNLVWSVVLRMTSNKDVSEDLFQEVFYRIFKEIKRFRGESRLSTWIASISYNVSADYLRRKKSRSIFTEMNIDEYEMPVYKGSPVDVYHKEEVKKIISELICQLPVSFQLVINLFYMEEFSYAEISAITSMPEGTIKSYLSRGRKIIKEKLLKMIPDFHEIHNEAFF